MNLHDIAKVIFTPETASENRIIKVVLFNDGRTAYEGKAKDLQLVGDIDTKNLKCKDLLHWSVLSIAPDMSFKPDNEQYPLYNYPILITVY